MLLAMLRNIARDGVSAEPILPVVQELSASSGPHISNVNTLPLPPSRVHSHVLTEVCPIPRSRVRLAASAIACHDNPFVYGLCLFMKAWRSADRPNQLPDFLGAIEGHTHARKREQSAANKTVRTASASSGPQAQVKRDPSALRYAAYNTPPSPFAPRPKPKRQESFNSLESYTSASHKGATLPVLKDNWQALSPDMVDLTRSVAGGSSRSVSPLIGRQVRFSFPILAKRVPEMMDSRTLYLRSHRRKNHAKIW
jgi:hypothetical protein